MHRDVCYRKAGPSHEGKSRQSVWSRRTGGEVGHREREEEGLLTKSFARRADYEEDKAS